MRSSLRSALILSLLPLIAGCAGRSASPANGATAYRVVWTARRTADNTLLTTVESPPVRVGAGDVRVRTDERRPTEDRPAFPEFRARLSALRGDRRPLELVTRVSVREAIRTRKGKRKVTRRYIGALLPLHPGETLGVNGPGDPITVEVRVGDGEAPK